MQAELLFADRELRRFVRSQYDFSYLGYPRMAAFAKDMARGTLSLPPIQQDPLMDCVGGFFFHLKQIERRILAEYYLGKSLYKCAKHVGSSPRRFARILEKLLWRCYYWIEGRGLN